SSYGCVITAPPRARRATIGDAKMDGFELEMQVAATQRLSFDYSAANVDFQYTRLDPTVAFNGPGGVPGGRGQMTLDMKAPYTPETTWSAGVQYAFPMKAGGSLTLRLDTAFQDEGFTQGVKYAPAQPVHERPNALVSSAT